jgi:FkbM family methyltransferase
MSNPLLSFAARAASLLPDPIKRSLYRLGPVTHLIRSSLNRAAPEGLTKVTIAAGELAGLKMSLDLQSEKDYWLGTYEPDLQAALKDLVKPGMIAYDVGANAGYISLLLGRAVGLDGKVFCFEPLPANQERLKTNLSLNPNISHFEIIPHAVVDQPGEVNFLVHSSDDMGKVIGSAGRDEEYEQAITIPATSLDHFIYQEGNPAPKIAKLDIEGGEVLALPGMRQLLTEARPLIFIELHGTESAQAAWEALISAGYTIHQMKSSYPQMTSLDSLDWKAYLVGRPPA